jgi:hypothetical protein
LNHATREQAAALAPLREQNDSLRAQNDENKRQLEATNQILRDAIAHRQGEVFETDTEVQKLNGARMDALADAIANRVAPKLPTPATPEEIARQQDQTVDQISSRTVAKLQPSIVEMESKQQVSQKELAATRVRLDQVTANLNQTQAAADDAIKLSRELSAMYLETYKDHGVAIRLLALPAERQHRQRPQQEEGAAGTRRQAAGDRVAPQPGPHSRLAAGKQLRWNALSERVEPASD